jgi:hypothetical protein
LFARRFIFDYRFFSRIPKNETPASFLAGVPWLPLEGDLTVNSDV